MLNVTGSRLRISSQTLSPVTRLSPKFSRAASLSQFQYCTKNGSSRPSCWRTSSIFSGLAVSPPASVVAASPGTSATNA